jgi:hypothetical protein
MLSTLAQTLTADPQSLGTWAESLGPIVAIASLLYAWWIRGKAVDYRTMLRAAAVGLKAAMTELDRPVAEEIKAGIKAAVGDLNEAMKAEVRQATAPAVKAYDDSSPTAPPRLGAIMLVSALMLSSGCTSAETRAAAHEHAQLLHVVRAASQPAPGVTPAKWTAGWDEAERGAALLEEASK